ncbi:NAD(+) diphosphatase [Puniceibacterium sp. IMCC21224]|uniref:NAD(+) diphosphatase n=1 Tax=Puniceibacterium sp. IMCC21224 TaxID=1618204 RepID=UPI00064DA598|nr:NAD(+) diphosphatase [Puniceibacterium sp. IMCC21224]
MRHAEEVTFGGSGLDRAGEVRGDSQALTALMTHKDTRAVVFWRGKPLITGDEAIALALVPMDHPVLAAAGAPILLGREDGAARVAMSLDNWLPEGGDPATLNAFADTSEQQHPGFDGDLRFVELRRVMTGLSPRDAELAASGKAVLGWHATHQFCARCGQPTKVSHGGWQRTCPACGAHHFPRTDPVVIMLITHGNRVLLGRSPGWPQGMFSCLAGFIEPGETIEAAVRREVYEESGIRIGAVDYLASQPWAFPSSLMIGCRGDALDETITIDPVEIEDARWVSREDLAEAFAGRHPEILPARNGAIAHFLLSNWLADRLD